MALRLQTGRGGALVQWLKVPAWKVRDCAFEHRSSIQVSKKQNVSSLLTRKYSILWTACSASDHQVSTPSCSRGQTYSVKVWSWIAILVLHRIINVFHLRLRAIQLYPFSAWTVFIRQNLKSYYDI